MIETGVNLTLNDNASAAARRAADGLEQVATAADEVNSALDPRMLDVYNQKLTEIGEAYTKLDKGMKLRDQYQAQQTRQMTGMIQSVGGGLVQAGRGDVAGGALSGVKSLTGLAGKISPVVAAGFAAVAAVGIGGNALANIYGERAGAAGTIAGLEGAMGTDIEANTMALRDAMRSTVDSVAKYGKTFEEGAKAADAFLRAGGSNFAGTSQAAAYSLARKADFNRLASFEGMTQRYGIGNGLAIVDALREAQGLIPAQYEEVMGGYQGIVSSRLGKGISGGGVDIARQLEFFSNANVTWQGGLGAQKVQGLNQAVAGAGGLQQQSDLFLYRAAAGLTAKTGGGLIETRMLMEKGLTPELFTGLMGQFGQMGYGREETIAQLQRTLNISATDANALYNMRNLGISGTKYEGLGGLAPGEGADVTTGYIETIEGVKQWVAELGEGIYELRVDAIDGTIEGFKDLVTAGDKLKDTFDNIVDGIKTFFGGGEGPPPGQYSRLTQERYSAQDYDRLMATMRQDEMMGEYGGIPTIQNKINEALKSGVSRGNIYGAIWKQYETMVGVDSSGNIGLDPSEVSILAKLLTELIEINKTTAENTGADIILEDNRGDTGFSRGEQED